MKQEILSQYKSLVQEKIEILQKMISDLAIDAQNDAKGSAGDKHETALSMMHLEQEKLSQKLKEVLEQKAILDKIDASQKHIQIGLGSLIQTQEFYYFISTALPKLEIENTTILALSPASPLGKEFMGKKVNDLLFFNGKSVKIENLI